MTPDPPTDPTNDTPDPKPRKPRKPRQTKPKTVLAQLTAAFAVQSATEKAIEKLRTSRLSEIAKELKALGLQVGKLEEERDALTAGETPKPAKPAKSKGEKASTKTGGGRGRPKSTKLQDAILAVLKGEKDGMRVKDIQAAVLSAGYETTAVDFYPIVAAALREDAFTKLDRGIYAIAK